MLYNKNIMEIGHRKCNLSFITGLSHGSHVYGLDLYRCNQTNTYIQYKCIDQVPIRSCNIPMIQFYNRVKTKKKEQISMTIFNLFFINSIHSWREMICYLYFMKLYWISLITFTLIILWKQKVCLCWLWWQNPKSMCGLWRC